MICGLSGVVLHVDCTASSRCFLLCASLGASTQTSDVAFGASASIMASALLQSFWEEGRGAASGPSFSRQRTTQILSLWGHGGR